MNFIDFCGKVKVCCILVKNFEKKTTLCNILLYYMVRLEWPRMRGRNKMFEIKGISHENNPNEKCRKSSWSGLSLRLESHAVEREAARVTL